MVAIGNAVCHIIPEVLVKVVVLSNSIHKAAHAWGLKLGESSLHTSTSQHYEGSSTTKQVFLDACRLEPCAPMWDRMIQWELNSNCCLIPVSVRMT